MLPVKYNRLHFSVNQPKEFLNKMLNWSSRFNIFCFLDHAGSPTNDQSFDCLLAVGAHAFVQPRGSDIFDQLQYFHQEHPGWLFGHLGYPQTPDYSSLSTGRISFGDAYFFSPSCIVRLTGSEVQIECMPPENPAIVFQQIDEQPEGISGEQLAVTDIRPDLDKEEYVEIINRLKWHIQRGDCYEINFCQEYVAEQVSIDPLFVYQQLRTISPNPFGAFYRLEDRYCLCASPERFLQKQADRVISQPIKGTSRRHPGHPEMDEEARQYLLNSLKEKAENVMVVDLVRNDLSRVALEGTVTVPELCGVYAFPQVFQMISTIEARVSAEMHWTKILEACFPMGSMTGAPKRRVMELINQYEPQPRGLFSGTIGYVTPGGDMDFNVVIRSIFYDDQKKLLTYKAGSGITAYCDPAAEYDECNLKAAAIKKILTGD